MHCPICVKIGKVYLSSSIAITVNPMEDLIIAHMYRAVMDLCKNELERSSSLEAVG